MVLDAAALVSGQIPNRRPLCGSDIRYSVLILTKNWTCCIIRDRAILGGSIAVFIVSLISLVLRSNARVVRMNRHANYSTSESSLVRT